MIGKILGSAAIGAVLYQTKQDESVKVQKTNQRLEEALDNQFGSVNRMGSRTYTGKGYLDLFMMSDPKMVSDRMLVAMLLYGNTGPKNPSDVAKDILDSVDDNLPALIGGSFLSDPNYTDSSKAKMIAAAELTRRANYRGYLSHSISSITVTSPYSMFRAFRDLNMSVGRQEVASILYFNNKMKVIGTQILSIGATKMTLLVPADVMSEALKRNAHGLAICHQHPSGDPKFSQQDIKIAEALKQAAKCVGLQLFDFIAIGGDDYSSAVEKGII
jgi:DNA repair protein RadC